MRLRALLGLLLAFRARRKAAISLAVSIAALNLLVPASIVVTRFEDPVTSFRSELKWFDNPPKEVDQHYWLHQARAAAAQGKLAAARHCLDNALALDPDNESALINRAMIDKLAATTRPSP